MARLSTPCLVALVLAIAWSADAINNGLGRVPQMGWNSWNQFACNINETIMEEMADALVSTGLAKLGYTYCNIDDCWAWDRLPNGTIQADPVTFPSGIPYLANYMHQRGLRLGIYTDLGNFTCQHRPGSLGYEVIDARTYAEWGVDYAKVDNCYDDNIPATERYPIMSKALNESGRAIFFSMCEWGQMDPATWAPALANSWRTTQDIKDVWISVLYNLDTNAASARYAGPGGWNDPDMLEVGVSLPGLGLTNNQQIAHFSLWALIKAPLILGLNLNNISADAMAIISNAEVIAVNQDPLGVQGSVVATAGEFGLQEVWAAPLSTGAVAVVLFNRDMVLSASIVAQWSDIGLSAGTTATVRDLWTHEDLGEFTGQFSANVDTTAVVMVLVTPM